MGRFRMIRMHIPKGSEYFFPDNPASIIELFYITAYYITICFHARAVLRFHRIYKNNVYMVANG